MLTQCLRRLGNTSAAAGKTNGRAMGVLEVLMQEGVLVLLLPLLLGASREVAGS